MIISYVVFEDDDDAIRFHQEWFSRQQDNLTGYGRLVASYKLPTRFCDQENPFPHKRDGWTKLQKRGWFVCPICKRPTPPPASIADFSEHGSYGFNIINSIKIANLGDTL